MIPKKIHYCWFGPKPYTQAIKKCIDTWKVHLPEYEFFLWNETNAPMDVPYIKGAYKTKKYAFVSDYVRFWALYNNGGIYLDTDIFLIRKFDVLLDNYAFFGLEEKNENILGCCVIGSSINNPFIGEIIKRYNDLLFDEMNLANLVIPRIVTPCYETYHNKNEITIYPYDYFYPFPYSERDNIANFLTYQKPNTFAFHLWNLSWVTKSAKLVSWTIRQMKKISIIRIILKSFKDVD